MQNDFSVIMVGTPVRGAVIFVNYPDMKTLFTTLLFVFSLALDAQAIRTDTVKQGYYIPFDSNYVSCKVTIAREGKKVEFANAAGNIIPDSLVEKIGRLDKGSVVTYSDVMIKSKDVETKSTTIRYVIGNRNSVYASRDPHLPDTLPAAEIASLMLDSRVESFEVSFFVGGSYYSYALTGNGIFGEARERILTLPSGTGVYVEKIHRKEEDGSVTTAPTRIYVVK